MTDLFAKLNQSSDNIERLLGELDELKPNRSDVLRETVIQAFQNNNVTYTDSDITRHVNIIQERLPQVHGLEQVDVARITQERNMLAKAIVRLGVVGGLINTEGVITGPNLLMICEDAINALVPPVKNL